jgi:NAD(P)-dependent dehydrogenase (short-subunit alcohol dehydrogenase family)
MNAPVDPKEYRPVAGSHHGRIVLVTGAGDGIGRAVSLALAAQGATVALLGRTQRKLEAVYDEIVAAGHPTPALLPFNLELAAAEAYAALFEALDSEFGRLDGLAHVAGILGTRSPIEHYDVPTWCKVLHVNLTAPFILTRTALPLLRRSPDASVVFTSSGVGRQGRAYWGAYAASKFGVEGLMQVLASEVAETTSVRSNSVNPGAVKTYLRLQAYPAEDRSLLPDPSAIVAPYLYLLGPDSAGVNGQAFDCQ